MTNLLRFVILAALLIVAIIFYTIGFSTGTVFIITLGVLFELAFWFGIFKVIDQRGTP